MGVEGLWVGRGACRKFQGAASVLGRSILLSVYLDDLFKGEQPMPMDQAFWKPNTRDPVAMKSTIVFRENSMDVSSFNARHFDLERLRV